MILRTLKPPITSRVASLKSTYNVLEDLRLQEIVEVDAACAKLISSIAAYTIHHL